MNRYRLFLRTWDMAGGVSMIIYGCVIDQIIEGRMIPWSVDAVSPEAAAEVAKLWLDAKSQPAKNHFVAQIDEVHPRDAVDDKIHSYHPVA